MVLIAGVDEAGKGPVLGPMMVAGVVMQEDRLNELNKLGVKDSKVLSATRRNYLSAKIKELAISYYILEVSARQIDEFRKIMTMNQIMVMGHANVLEQLKPNKAYLDAADVKEERFGENVKKKCVISMEIVAKHKADTKFPIVSAASILAKAHRDRAMRDLEKKIGVPLGSGYPSDPVTKKFLSDWIKENKNFPEIVRHSWKTTKNLLNL
jgi:ribonuclease HII